MLCYTTRVTRLQCDVSVLHSLRLIRNKTWKPIMIENVLAAINKTEHMQGSQTKFQAKSSILVFLTDNL
jgi:hypothetical protein